MKKANKKKKRTKTMTSRIVRSRFALPVVFALIFGAFGLWILANTFARTSGTGDINNVSVQLGPEEYVMGPSSSLDSAYFIERDLRGRYYGFVANQTSYVFKLNSKGKPIVPTKKAELKQQIVVSKDQRPKDKAKAAIFDREELRGLHPDRCGAWLLSAIHKNPKNKKHWIAWYHGEDRCNYNNGGETHMTLAFVESFNAGKTWKKTGYPNNRIITADTALKNDIKTDDAGGARILLIGDHYYIFYRASTRSSPNNQINVARSAAADLGRPGTWLKWYCANSQKKDTCDFTEPGLGGKSTSIGLPAPMRFISYNRYLKRYITMQAHGDGFQLRASEGKDFLTWKPKKDPVYPAVTHSEDYTVQNWNYGGDPKKCKNDNRPTSYECKQLYAYTSVIGMKGDGERTGKEFYIYYTKFYPGEEHSQRYLLRRTVTLFDNPSSQFMGNTQEKTTRVELTLYQKKNGDKRITTELPKPGSGYRAKSKIGYVLSAPAKGYQPLFECRTPKNEYYTMRLPTNTPYGVPVASNPPTKCNTTDTLIRRIGWVSPTRTDEAPVPIASNNSGVTGRSASTIGYALSTLE